MTSQWESWESGEKGSGVEDRENVEGSCNLRKDTRIFYSYLWRSKYNNKEILRFSSVLVRSFRSTIHFQRFFFLLSVININKFSGLYILPFKPRNNAFKVVTLHSIGGDIHTLLDFQLFVGIFKNCLKENKLINWKWLTLILRSGSCSQGNRVHLFHSLFPFVEDLTSYRIIHVYLRHTINPKWDMST